MASRSSGSPRVTVVSSSASAGSGTTRSGLATATALTAPSARPWPADGRRGRGPRRGPARSRSSAYMVVACSRPWARSTGWTPRSGAIGGQVSGQPSDEGQSRATPAFLARRRVASASAPAMRTRGRAPLGDQVGGPVDQPLGDRAAHARTARLGPLRSEPRGQRPGGVAVAQGQRADHPAMREVGEARTPARRVGRAARHGGHHGQGIGGRGRVLLAVGPLVARRRSPGPGSGRAPSGRHRVPLHLDVVGHEHGCVGGDQSFLAASAPRSAASVRLRSPPFFRGRSETSTSVASARSAPTVHCARGRWENGVVAGTGAWRSRG